MYWIPAFQEVTQTAAGSFDWSRLLRPEVLLFLIPIAAVLVGGVVSLAKMLITPLPSASELVEERRHTVSLNYHKVTLK